MSNLYREHILDHARNPRYPGVLAPPCDVDYEAHNPLCGDYLRVTLRLDDTQRINAIAWDGEGCAISQATASILSERLMSQSLDQVLALTKDDILAMLNVPLTANREKCALLALNALINGIHEAGITEGNEE